MAAIAGVFHLGVAKPVVPARVRAMADAMAHRGPAGVAAWTAAGIGLAQRWRDGPEPPLTTADGRFAMVVDGRVANAAALRAELHAAGSSVDDEHCAALLLQGYAAWGPALLERVEGDFALAVHDAQTESLLLARDRSGAKPLHFVELPDGALAFASELKGLLAHPLMRRAGDAAAAATYLARGYVPDGCCLVAGVHKLPAGHFMLVERGRPLSTPRRWWRIGAAPRADAQALLDTMRVVVRERMSATGATGALLSDAPSSAGVVALMAEASRRAVHSCTIGASDGRAAAVAARFATAHRSAALEPDEAIVPALAHAFDEPFADPRALSAWHGAMLARDAVDVVVTDAGADLLFARVPPPAWAMWRKWTPDRRGRDRHHASALRRALFSAETQRVLADRAADIRCEPADLSGSDLSGAELCAADRIGAATGVELRAPLLDHRLVAMLAGTRPGEGERLLRRALARHLPADMLRPAPPAPVPLDTWFRGALAQHGAALLRSRVLAETGWFDLDRLAGLAEAHRDGREDHGLLLWRFVMLEASLRHLFG